MLNKSPDIKTAWADLHSHKREWSDKGLHLRDLFDQDKDRFYHYHILCDGLTFDYSKNFLTDGILTSLKNLIHTANVPEFCTSMRDGAVLNTTENRAVLHTALRGSCNDSIQRSDENIVNFVDTLHEQIKTISAQIRNNPTITDVIHIGVGGSDLGPNLVCEALSPLHTGPKIHFLKNIDGQSVTQCLKSLTPKNTAVLIASKSFTTLETSYNAKHVKAWMEQDLSPSQCEERLFAMTATDDKAIAFGIPKDHILPMRDWVGGRFSLWSSIGLPIAIALGFDVFKQLLNGAKTADDHFFNAPFEQNIPMIMGALSVWYRNIWDYRGHAILPYADSLHVLPLYMQQLEMESNGKHSDHHRTAPIVFGNVGTSSQHAFMQSLHQSAEITPCDFIVIASNPYAPKDFQDALNGNALAQSQALMRGRPCDKEPHRHFEGNRPSSTFLLPELTPHYLGMLLAFYEHKIVVEGKLWNINSFDQWGVELGKTLANDIIADLSNGAACDSHDSSTKSLIHAIVEKQKQ